MEEEIKKRIWLDWLLILATIFFTFLLIAAGANFLFDKKYENRIYPGVWLGQYSLEGLTKNQAKDLFTRKIDEFEQTGLNFYYNSAYTTLLPTVASAESDLIYFLINFDVDKTIASAYAIGRSNNFFNNLKTKLNALIYGHPIELAVNFEDDKIIELLKGGFSEHINQAKDAYLFYSDGDFSVIAEKPGEAIDYEKGLAELKNKVRKLNFTAITLDSSTATPKISREDCELLLPEARELLELAPLNLNYENKNWLVPKNELGAWIMATTEPNQKEVTKARLVLNNERALEYFSEEIFPAINREPQEAKFSMEDNRVVEFQASQDGIEVNTPASIKLIEDTLLKSSSTVELITKVLKSKTKTQDANDLGIDEIIGTGESNFSGSPANRRHNIKNGADTLHGLLIKPDEEFSLVTALGEIEAETGYLPELVIKGNQTIPEYGGGLCQIGTTMFRAALGTGLPITMRRNHSYRVSYYEPAGTDATIYNPWPDLKFINDTDNYILIQSRIDGDNLYFDFWGTSDGRIASRTRPIIYNITKPEPTKYVETLDLPVGDKRCTEHAHNGADTYFDYIVSFPDGEAREERFKSHYIPWREVCLIGVEKLSTDTEEGSATTTEENINN